MNKAGGILENYLPYLIIIGALIVLVVILLLGYPKLISGGFFESVYGGVRK